MILAVLAVSGGCRPGVIDGVKARDAFGDGSDVWSAPWPRPALFEADGHPRVEAWPNPGAVKLVDDTLKLLAKTTGASQSGGVFFAFDGALDPATVTEETAGIIAIPSGARAKVLVHFEADAGPFGTKNVVTLLPRPGLVLAPDTDHVAFVLRLVLDGAGGPVGRSQVMADLLAGRENAAIPADSRALFAKGVAALEAAGIAPDDVAALTVFHTGDVTADFARVVTADRTAPAPSPTTFEFVESFEKFCVYKALVTERVYQQGTPPYASEGGAWGVDASGAPLVDHSETARVFVTIPRKITSNSTLPVALFVRTGGGGDRPLIDRGLRTVALGGTTPGTGPANWLADAGVAGVQVDGPHGGPRNVSNGDEQFLMFNVLNPAALRDNVRQSALELVRLLDGMGDWTLDASDCEGVGSAANSLHFDASRAVLIGHSMGATISPLVLPHAPGVRATILSGAGGSYLENVVHKKHPLEVAPIAEALLGYDSIGRHVHEFDPVLSLVQWGGDPADPPAYLVKAAPRLHSLVFQGIVDNYILPPMANALNLPLGSHPVLPLFDSGDPRLSAFEPIASLVPAGFLWDAPVDRPAGDADAGVRALVQLMEDPIEDGHEVMFQREDAHRAVACFLRKLQADRVVVNLAGCE